MTDSAPRGESPPDDELIEMVRWAYSKLHPFTFTKMEDALMLDRLKLYCEHGVFG